ncbi:hypothetical protein QGM71_21275 [Virgibacillus sp. C22-A2]|uniref:MarR family transcriptional regulator n=1 Tax=Virgibacillus tibetensis TaxID=3042313 RepID=A0ABU6KLH1_9BACI|nr:hypothetical protein [Virgibacillus sp. C22-A2]
MTNILEIAQNNKLSLIEVSILVELDKKYPRTVSIDEVTTNKAYWKIKKGVQNLIAKGFVEEEFKKYKIRK